MIGRLRKWLGSSIELRLRWGDLLVIIALVILINAIWPSVPAWVFLLAGAAIPIAERAGHATARSFGRWLHRKGTA